MISIKEILDVITKENLDKKHIYINEKSEVYIVNKEYYLHLSKFNYTKHQKLTKLIQKSNEYKYD